LNDLDLDGSYLLCYKQPGVSHTLAGNHILLLPESKITLKFYEGFPIAILP